MNHYNWKNHYSVRLTECGNAGGFFYYRIKEAGEGKVISGTVFPGIQAVYNDLNLFQCGKSVPKTEQIVEINYCVEGRYECEVNRQYCFYAIPGDLSVGNAGRREAAGRFPNGRFSGLTLFIDLTAAREQNAVLFGEMEIDLDVISRMALQEPRRFYLRSRSEIDAVCYQMVSAVKNHSLPLLKLRTLELLMRLSDSELLCDNEMPPYLSRKNVQLAKNTKQRLIRSEE